ncbi:CHAT domain-containing protein [Streptomyces sp. NPDC058307]|uniref:CHAT domain-containing protein n=1 Tax=Streptomyces sp. NPDC058307 TaxID=3346439 RepID=UPI0036E1AC1F
MRDNLFRMRTTWVDGLTARVCRELGPDPSRYDMFPSWVADEPPALAALLARIAVEDIRGSSPQAISDHLRSTSLVDSRVPGHVVAEDLVMPVLRTVRNEGVPWQRWWDVAGFHVLLVELWAGHRLSTQPADTVREELTSVWCLPDQAVETVLRNAADPYASLPPDLLHESATGRASACLQALVSGGWVKITRTEDVLRARPGLTDRPDLAEVAKRLHRRMDLENAVDRIRNPSAEFLAGLREDLEAWDAQMGGVVSHLTAYELALMQSETGDDQYAEECLVAGRAFYRAPLLEDDALLWESKPSDLSASVPDWMVEEIVTCGTRFFHTRVGPHPVWLATAETDSHLAAVRALMETGTRYGFGTEDYSDGIRIWLQFPLPPGDPGPPMRAPYTYSLTWVEHAWELLHLATVGYTRLSVVRLVGDGEVRAVSSIWLELPEELLVGCKDAAITALRRLVGDETQNINQRIALEGVDQAAETAFRSCENAKSEDIQDELSLASDTAEFRHFMSAARRLAGARAWLASRLLDGEEAHGANVELKTAVEERQRTLELLRATAGRGKVKTGSIGEADIPLLDEQTVFVHLINRYGTLQLAACRTRAGRAHFDLVSCEEISLGHLPEVVNEWAKQPQNAPGRMWYQFLEQVLAECSEIAEIIAEMMARHDFRRLMLSPAAPLELLPLHAATLHAPRTVTLSDLFDHVAYAPTARLATAIKRSQRRVAAVEVLVVAHSGDGVPGFESIGGPLCEADLIADLYDHAEVLAQEEATPDRALEAMSRARIVHVASHGLTHLNRWAAGVVLQGDSLGAATLTTSRILAEGTFSSVDLVILNACRTGTHEGAGRTVQTLRSLESAFLARGAKAVVSTLWEITDLQGVVFSAVLHAYLGAGVDPHTAFADTARYLRAGHWQVPCHGGPLLSAESAIDSMLPDWRSHLDQQVAENPLFWAAFKITGVV